MTLEVVILSGLQASGKTTFCSQRFPSTHRVVSKDHFRNNKNRRKRQELLIRDGLICGQSVVVDNTNVEVASRVEIILIAREYGATVKGYFFRSRVDDCLKRNATRVGHACVPHVAIFGAIKRLVYPSWSEGYDELYEVTLTPEGTFSVQAVSRSS
jgi:predicted kinase